MIRANVGVAVVVEVDARARPAVTRDNRIIRVEDRGASIQKNAAADDGGIVRYGTIGKPRRTLDLGRVHSASVTFCLIVAD